MFQPLNKQTREMALQHPNDLGTVRFELIAGLLVRGEIRTSLARLRFQQPLGVTISFEENKGWIESTFFVKLYGQLKDVISIADAIDRIVQENS